MRIKTTKKLTFLITLIICAGSGFSIADERHDTEEKRAHASCEERLKQCNKKEVKCIWYSNYFSVANTLSFDFNTQSITDFRYLYDYSTRGDARRRIATKNVHKLKKILQQLPKSHKDINPLDSLSIAYWEKNQLKIVRYSRKNLPLEVRRIYDIGGGLINGTFAGSKVRRENQR